MRHQNGFMIAVILLFLQLDLRGQDGWPLRDWPVATPQSESMNADSLRAFDEDIVRGKYGYVDKVVITRHGKLLFEKSYAHDYDKIYNDSAQRKSGLNQHDPSGQYNYYNPWWHPYYRSGELHSLQSVSKTITSIVIGVAVTRKEFPDLSTPVLSFFDTNQVKAIDDRKRKMNIRHLLTMTAGFDWDEGFHYSDPRNDCTRMEGSFDWIQYVIDKPMAIEPGQSFKYNSGATQLLSYIFRKATGKDLEEYAAQHLFSPLGISRYYWKRTPTGLPDAEGGFYLEEKDLAKIYYLFLKDGNWNGKQLVNREWVRESVSPAIKVRPGVLYGYKWWLYAYDDDQSEYAWAGSGFGGQWPIVIPEYGIVAVFTGWNIIGGRPSLRVNEAIRRLVNASTGKK